MLVDFLPTLIQENLHIIALLLIGFLVENYYISRLSVFSNSIALNLYVNTFTTPGFFLSLYADIGLLLGLLGILAYLSDTEMGRYYYNTTYLAFSSATVGFVLLVPLGIGWLLAALVLGIVVNFLLLDFWGEAAAPIAG